MQRITVLFFVLIATLSNSSCQKSSELPTATMPAPMVTVGNPVSKSVPYFEYFQGNLESTERVEIRARVSGYLNKIHFQPGAEVKKGDRLIDIDPRPFEAEIAQAKSMIERSQALVNRLTLDFNRNEKLVKTGAVSQEDFDKIIGNKLEAEANVKAEKAKLQASELDLDFTTIDAPIDGKVGDRLVTEGNLVTGGQTNTTLLTTIVAVDKMFLSFDCPESVLQRIQENVRKGIIKTTKGQKIPVEMGIQAIHADQFPLKGEIVFINNEADRKTGTIRIKAEFPNPKSAEGARVLTPGMFAKIRVRIGDPVPSILVPDSALGSDMGTKFIYLVEQDNKAKRCNVTIGGLDEGLRVIESIKEEGKEPRALRTDERVIINGIQRVRPGMTVDPKDPGAKKTSAQSGSDAAKPSK
ncbi:MAG: efflux RND transporter periplasmic adaptor subunit [Planctomycetia bacterium]|nr:efflux RND transporter periplasmic adaptor subunit [Planctomycetia bacterium]